MAGDPAYDPTFADPARRGRALSPLDAGNSTAPEADQAAPEHEPLEITRFTKTGGPLTKAINLVDGQVVSDGSQCVMPAGRAERVRFKTAHELADIIAACRQD